MFRQLMRLAHHQTLGDRAEDGSGGGRVQQLERRRLEIRARNTLNRKCKSI